MSLLRVHRVPFPRPSESQFGWIGATLSAPAFNANLTPAIEQERRSERTSRASVSVYALLDQPQDDWIGGLGLWEIPYGVASQTERLSFRTPDIRVDKTYIRVNQPHFDWLTAQLNLWEVCYGVALHAEAQSYRTADAQKDKTYLRQEQPAPAWIFTNLPPYTPLDPTLWGAIEQEMRSFRMGERKQDKTFLRQAQTIVDWIRVLNLREAPYGAATHAQALSFRPPKRNTTPLLDEPPDGWIYSGIPAAVFDVAFFAAIHSQMQSARTAAARQELFRLLEWVIAFAPGALTFSVSILGPYFAEAAQLFMAHAIESDIFTAGANDDGDVFTAGVTKGQA